MISPQTQAHPSSFYGPYYCDINGKYVSIDEASNPKYDPYVRFSANGVSNRASWIYHLESETFWEIVGARFHVILKDSIPIWVLDELFKKEPSIYKSLIGGFGKFIFPAVRSAWPKLTNIFSVQPMTTPVGGIAFYRPRYGSTSGSVKCGSAKPK